MTKFKIEFSTDNDAFCDDYWAEIKWILNVIIGQINTHGYVKNDFIKDSNGNKIGKVETEYDRNY